VLLKLLNETVERRPESKNALVEQARCCVTTIAAVGSEEARDKGIPGEKTSETYVSFETVLKGAGPKLRPVISPVSPPSVLARGAVIFGKHELPMQNDVTTGTEYRNRIIKGLFLGSGTKKVFELRRLPRMLSSISFVPRPGGMVNAIRV
jgi:hypothetical protein